MAVEAALGEAMRGYVVGREALLGLDGQRGVLVLEAVAADEIRRGAAAQGRGPDAADAAMAAAAGEGGGRLAEAIRVDPVGAATRLLARSVWVPDLGAALAVQPKLPAGWTAVTRDGAVVTSYGVVSMGRAESLLERRAEVEHLAEEVARLSAEANAAAAESGATMKAAATARTALDAARETERRSGATRHEAEESERRATRALETIAREAAWRSAQAARLEVDRDRLAESIRQAEAATSAAASGAAADKNAAAGAGATAGAATGPATSPATGPAAERASALREWEARAASLRARRDQLAAEEATLEGARRDAEVRRARASAAANLDEDRIASLERQTSELARREQEIGAQREGLGEDLAAAALREAAVRTELDELRAAAAVGRSKLAEAEAAAMHARDRLRTCQDRVRAAEVAELEARLALDSIREQVLVELAGLGDLGIRLLIDEGNGDDGEGGDSTSDEAYLAATREARRRREAAARSVGAGTGAGNGTAAGDGAGTGAGRADDDGNDSDPEAASATSLESLLSAATTRWAKAPSMEPPGATKLAQLRRRFHELGAPNPFAAEEYDALKTRLDGLESQRSDLNAAISKTRALIEQLNVMIATQFRSTFSALETAFDARFRQLFGGGFARLSLTDPEDLAGTGIEIVARPPGKKAQPLSMLSGGERTLTAVALLFSMLEVHPVPFCVLDEVDAALDEANVGRFADALRSLADQTQFVVITHNRGTIEAADALYGVTVGDDAVSRVISLRLEEARDLADQVNKKSAAATAG